MKQVATALALALLLTAPATAAWSQGHGGAWRTGVMDVTPDLWDIGAPFWLHDDEWTTYGRGAQSYVVTPYGVTTVLRPAGEGDGCRLVHFDAEGSPLTIRQEFDLSGCPGASLQGYDAERDLIVLCTTAAGGAATLQVRTAGTGEPRFFVRLSDQSTIVDDVEGEEGRVFTCHGGVIDPNRGTADVAVVGAVADGDDLEHHIVHLRLDDGHATRTRLTQPLPSTNDPTAQLATGPWSQTRRFFPLAVTASDSGLFVTGKELRATDGRGEPFVAMIPLDDGAEPIFSAPGQGWRLSATVAADGATGLARLGDELLVMDASQLTPLRRVAMPVGDADGVHYDDTPGPVRQYDAWILPTRVGIAALDGHELTLRWSWPGFGNEWLVRSVAATPSGDVAALVMQDGPSPVTSGEVYHRDVRLVRLDGFTGRLLQSLPVPLESRGWLDPALPMCDQDAPVTTQCDPIAAAFDWLPLPDGRILVAAPEGKAVIVGPTASLPPLALSSAYPAQGESVHAGVEVPPAVAKVIVAWGDHSVDERERGQERALFRAGAADNETTRLDFTHTYRETGVHEGTATLVFEDGATATRPFRVDVGGAPPPDLTFMQRQFAPDNQDRTWGVIGLLLAAMGGAYTLYFRTRRQRRIQRELERLDAIHERSLVDPEGALADLDERQRYLRRCLMTGRLDDGQFQLVQGRASGISKRLHRRLLGPVAPRLSPTFHAMLEAAFGDAWLSAEERRDLDRLLQQETGLREDERAYVTRLLGAWSQTTQA